MPSATAPHDRFVAVYRQVHAMIRDEVAIAMQRSQ